MTTTITTPSGVTIIAVDRPAPQAVDRILSRRQFMERIGLSKYATLAAQSKYAAWRDYIVAGDYIDLDNQATIDGLAYAKTQGDLTDDDIARIRA